MRLLFVTKPHLPAIGGAQLTTHFLALELQRRGHTVTVLARRAEHDPTGTHRDAATGYLVIRSPDTERELPAVVAEHSPQCVVVGGYHGELSDWTGAMLRAAAPLPTILYAHDIGVLRCARPGRPPASTVAAVSDFLARELRSQSVDAAVIRPIVDAGRYRVRSSRRIALFVNPVPAKGLNTALALAGARPDIPFAFVRCWHIGSEDLGRLRDHLSALPNVELRESVTDPAELYGDARVVLMPSTYPEAWGRVAAEAVAASIPVLASAVGGLPESVGGGGVLIPPSHGPERWVRHLSGLWDDESTYSKYLSRADDAAAGQQDISATSVGEAFESLVERTIGLPR
jgi:glycosyltransferase involved in cell wall biosynthesis